MGLSRRALFRRVKRHVLAREHQYVAICTPGLETTVFHELESLPIPCTINGVFRGGVSFSGRTDAFYAANLYLRTASRILMRLGEFPAPTTEALFNRTRMIRWEMYVGSVREIRLTITSRKSRLNQKKKIASVVQDAIRERLKTLGANPITVNKKASLEFLIRLEKDRCTFSFNTSGDHLHKRGWRTLTSAAPVRETLASHVLANANLEEKDLLVDPFCGSGTFVIEAALCKARVPPGLERQFAFEQSPIFEPRKWEHLRVQGQKNISSNINCRLVGYDIDEPVIEIARKSATAAGVSDLVTFQIANALDLLYVELASGKKSPLLVANLPYGRRLAETGVLKLFASVAGVRCRGWSVALMCMNAAELDDLSLDQRSVLNLSNGGLRVQLLQGQIPE